MDENVPKPTDNAPDTSEQVMEAVPVSGGDGQLRTEASAGGAEKASVPLEVQLRRLWGWVCDWFQELARCAQDISGSNLVLGNYHLSQGNLNDAVLRFWVVTKLAPRNADAWLGLARAYAAKGQKPKAGGALRRLFAVQPNHAEGRELQEMLRRAPEKEAK